MKDIRTIRHTVTAIILNEDNEVLGVSRKNDHNDFGLPGGKVDECDYDIFNNVWFNNIWLPRSDYNMVYKEAIKREVKEETGLDINVSTMFEILSMPRYMNGKTYWGHSFLIKDWSGEIKTEEPHIVKWTTFEELEDGCFGDWNKIARECLQSIDINII